MGRRAVALLPPCLRRRRGAARHARELRRVPPPGPADPQDQPGREPAGAPAVRRVSRRAAGAVRLAPHLARADLHPAPRRGARRDAGARRGGRRHGCAPRRGGARDPVLPHHAGRTPAPSRLRGVRLPGHQRRHRGEPPPGGGGARLGRDGVRRHAELPRQPRRHGARDGPRPPPRPPLPGRLLDRRGAHAGAAPRARGHLRHRALRPLRGSADRTARRRMSPARRHARPFA